MMHILLWAMPALLTRAPTTLPCGLQAGKSSEGTSLLYQGDSQGTVSWASSMQDCNGRDGNALGKIGVDAEVPLEEALIGRNKKQKRRKAQKSGLLAGKRLKNLDGGTVQEHLRVDTDALDPDFQAQEGKPNQEH